MCVQDKWTPVMHRYIKADCTYRTLFSEPEFTLMQ